jgi:predicted small metal-binding protein
MAVALLDGTIDAWAGTQFSGPAADPDLPPGPTSGEVRERFVRYRVFKDALESALADLAERKIALKEAQVRVSDAARDYQPEHFFYLRCWEQGDSDDERVARNLVGHIRESHGDCVLPELETEMEHLVIELRKRF